MRFDIAVLARPADDVDLSSATSAKPTGPAVWVDAQVLEIPFDRELTTDEAAAVVTLLTSVDDSEATRRRTAEEYLSIKTSPTAAQNAEQIRTLTRLVLGLADPGRRVPTQQ